MIYSRCYAPVKLISGSVVREKSARRGDEFDNYYVTAQIIGHYPDGSGKIGEMVHDGKEFPVCELKADGGLTEIMDEFEKLPGISLAW